MQNKPILKLKASSLVEVLLYMALLSGMIFAIGGVVREMFTARNKQQSVIEVENEAMMVMQLLKRDLKDAQSISAPAPGATGNTLTYARTGTPAYNRSYSLNGGVLQQTTTPGSTTLLTSNRVVLSNLSFRRVAVSTTLSVVNVSFTASYSNPGGRNDLSYQRNYATSIVIRPGL